MKTLILAFIVKSMYPSIHEMKEKQMIYKLSNIFKAEEAKKRGGKRNVKQKEAAAEFVLPNRPAVQAGPPRCRRHVGPLCKKSNDFQTDNFH